MDESRQIMQPIITTFRGQHVNILYPHPESFTISDIAHALSLLCRFTGHVQHFYSVAQHSIAVSHLVPEELALTGLLHDASEAFLGDVSSPLKRLLPDYKQLEAGMEQVIAVKFGTTYPMPDAVKQADLIMLATERRDLLAPDDDAVWEIIQDIKPREEKIDLHAVPQDVEFQFLQRFMELCDKKRFPEDPLLLNIGAMHAEASKRLDGVCFWEEDEEAEGEYWNTGCGSRHLFLSAGPFENGYNYCPYCGQLLRVESWQLPST